MTKTGQGVAKPKSGFFNRPVFSWIGLLFRLILGTVMLVAGGLKITNLEQSVFAVKAYDLVGLDLAKVIGYSLPILEIVVGLLLIFGIFTRLAALATSTLMIVFIFGIASAWIRGISLDCGCFGAGGLVDPDQTQYLPDILRDLALLAGGIFLTIRPKSVASVDSWIFKPITLD